MDSGMEPEVREFLRRAVWSLSAVVLYLIVNSTAGIWGGWMFFYERPTLGNYIFYAWLVFSTVVLVRLVLKWWKKKFPHG